MTQGKTVKDTFSIDLEKIRERSSEGDYWEACFKFFRGIRDMSVDGLYPKEIEWLKKIEKDLEKK